MRNLIGAALLTLAACADEETKYNEKCGGPWYARGVSVDTSGAAPVFSWPTEFSADAENWWFAVQEVDENVEAVGDTYAWELSGGLIPTPLTYAVVPEGVTEESPATELVSGTRYLAGVSFDVDGHECLATWPFSMP